MAWLREGEHYLEEEHEILEVGTCRYQIRPSMTVFIEGLHRTTGLWSGYVEGVKVYRQRHFTIKESSKYHQYCATKVLQVKNKPSSDKEVSPPNDDCWASFSHVSLDQKSFDI